MKLSVTAPALAVRRGAWFVLTLLLPALATEIAETSVPQARGAMECTGLPAGTGGSSSYLPLVGAPALRFLEAIPPPDVVARPPAGGPPRTGAQWNADVVRKPALVPSLEAPTTPAPVAQKRDVILPEKPTVRTLDDNRPAAILPDDSAPKVKPEDFLPFFEFPGVGKQGDGSAAAGSASPAPRSSATYKEQ